MSDSENKKFQVGDRVSRPGVNGPIGTVKKVRTETTRTSVKKDGAETPGITVSVLWDNGTLSHFIPEGLEHNNA